MIQYLRPGHRDKNTDCDDPTIKFEVRVRGKRHDQVTRFALSTRFADSQGGLEPKLKIIESNELQLQSPPGTEETAKPTPAGTRTAFHVGRMDF